MNSKLVLPLAFAFAALVSPAQSASIIWTGSAYVNRGTQNNTMGIDQFNQSGTKIFAVNLGGAAATLVQSADPNLAFSASSSQLAVAPSAGPLGIFTLYHVDAATNAVSSTADYSNSNTYLNTTLSGLTIGATYRIQVLSFDGRFTQFGRTVAFDGVNLGQYANGVDSVTYGNGILATGTFIADATTQTFRNEAFSAPLASAGGHMNAILLYQIPEPSSALLMMMGATASGLLRRRRN